MASHENNFVAASYRRLHESIDFSRINILKNNNVQLVWIDRQYQSDDLGPLLQKLDPSTKFFDDVTSAIDYLSSHEESFLFLVIFSGEFGKEMIEKLEDLSQILAVFIYCLDVRKYEYLKEKSLKLLTICDQKSVLIDSIASALRSPYVPTVQQYSMRDLNKEQATFIWFQLLKRLVEKLTTDNQQLALVDLKNEIKNYCQTNRLNREDLLGALEQYVSTAAIWLYTRQGSLSDIINEALRQQNIDLLYRYRHLIRDLSQALSRSQINSTTTVRVHRGCVLPKESFNKLKQVARQQTFVSTFGYLSTSKEPQVAQAFADNGTPVNNSCCISVIFEIDIKPDTNVTAAYIGERSYFQDEDEILFDFDSVFKILEVTGDENNQPCRIHMETSNYGSELSNEYLRYNEKELDQFNVELLFGRVIVDMGEYEKSIEYYEKLLDKSSTDQIDLRIHLGRVYTLKGDYNNALKCYNEGKQMYYDNINTTASFVSTIVQYFRHFFLSIFPQYTAQLPESNKNSTKMAEITHGLGWLADILGDYKAAIEQYRKSLQLYETSKNSGCWQMKATLHTKIAMALAKLTYFDEAIQELDNAYECMKKAELPNDHPDFSQHIMNLGEVWQLRGDYDQAEQFYNHLLEIRRRTLPPAHLDIAKTLYRLGSFSAQARKNFKIALDYFHQALVISRNAVGELHPTTILIWGGIANVYLSLNEFQQALKYQFKTLELYEKIYNSKDHEEKARVLNNIGELYRRMKDYEKALEYFNKGLQMRQALYGSDHIEIGTIHVNLAETYRDMGDYKTGLQHAERGMNLWKKKLLSSADYMDEGEALLNELRTLVAQNKE